MSNEARRRVVTGLLYYISLSIAICLLTLIDMAHFTLYITYWLPAFVVIGISVLLYLIEPLRPRAVFLGLLLAWIAILPYVRWDRVKSFFIDAHRLRVGMTTTQVRTIMEPYLEFEYDDSIKFKPSEGGGDICIVYLEDGRVVRIKIEVD